MIKIITDSTCDLPAEWLDQYNITVIPVNIQFGLETFQEGINLTPAEFYRRIQSGGALPTTSQPAVGEYSQICRQLAADGSHLLAVHLTSKLSGTWQAAALAARHLAGQVELTVVDSHTGSVGLGCMVREAAQLAEEGWPVDDIVTHLQMRRAQTHVFILLKDLRFARLSGRVGRIRENLTTLLNIKPIIGVEQGALILKDRVRGQKRGFEQMLTLAEEAAGHVPVHLAVSHAQARPDADALLARATSRLNCRDTFVTDLALSIAVHFGPGTVGFATYPAV